jgi:hypothetical protein
MGFAFADGDTLTGFRTSIADKIRDAMFVFTFIVINFQITFIDFNFIVLGSTIG